MFLFSVTCNQKSTEQHNISSLLAQRWLETRKGLNLQGRQLWTHPSDAQEGQSWEQEAETQGNYKRFAISLISGQSVLTGHP